MGQNAIAITDHGNMSCVYDLYVECKKEQIQPVFGIEFYHIVEGHDKRFHLTAWAKSMNGLKNLYKLHELSHRNQVTGHYGKKYPIVTYKDLFQYKEDIIIATACLAGHIPYCIMSKSLNEVYTTIEMLKDKFGGDFYLELQSNTIPEQKSVNEELIRLSKLYNVKTILTSDSHYILQSDAKVHEMLLCMQTKDKMNNPKRFRFDNEDFWLKTEQEMLNTTEGVSKTDMQIALNNTDEIAEKCKFEFELPKEEDALPRYSDDEKQGLRDLCNKGWKEKKHSKSKVELERTKFELDIIEQKGYSGYFLIVADYINWAKDNNIVVGGGRGSGAGSFVAYLCGMTTINAIEHGLLFERRLRSLNPVNSVKNQ